MPVAVRRAILLAMLASLILRPTPALAQSAPRLAALTIDVWPEFDRPSTVLVIYRGQFAPDAPLPTPAKIRIPASAGEPYAVAAPAPGNEASPVTQWLDLKATGQVFTTTNGAWIEMTFIPPSRLFTVEFYDKISTATSDRRYVLTWPGDVAADAVTLGLREPVGATDFEATPALSPGVTDADGFVAHQLTQTGLGAGQPFTLSLSYRREDKRTSVEMLQLTTPMPTQQPSPAPGVDAQPRWWLFVAALAVGLGLLGGGAAWYLLSRRTDTFRPYEPPVYRRATGRRSARRSGAARPRPQPSPAVTSPSEATAPAGFCTQCGKPLQPDDSFCSRCGARVKGK